MFYIGFLTFGWFVREYPSPGLVIVIGVVREPSVTAIVAVAVVPTPTPTYLGAENLTLTEDPVYPEPALTMLSDWIVPAAETTAVTAAETGSTVSTIKASKDEITMADSFSS